MTAGPSPDPRSTYRKEKFAGKGYPFYFDCLDINCSFSDPDQCVTVESIRYTPYEEDRKIAALNRLSPPPCDSGGEWDGAVEACEAAARKVEERAAGDAGGGWQEAARLSRAAAEAAKRARDAALTASEAKG